jgi:hypothetical protein
MQPGQDPGLHSQNSHALHYAPHIRVANLHAAARRHVAPIQQGSAALPHGFLRGHWLTPGAQQQLQEELEPPIGDGLFQVVKDAAGRPYYQAVTHNKKLLITQAQCRCVGRADPSEGRQQLAVAFSL